MIPELGHIALIIAFCLAISLALVPAWGAARRNVSAMNMAPTGGERDVVRRYCVFAAGNEFFAGRFLGGGGRCQLQ